MDYDEAEVLLSRIKAITLLEILTVIIIIGILAVLAMPQYGKMKEATLDKEAKANLKLIQAGEKIYEMETGGYLACATTVDINDDLRLSLPAGANCNWNYSTNANGDAFAERNGDDSRIWTLLIGDEEPS